jgi:hypothetical protein
LIRIKNNHIADHCDRHALSEIAGRPVELGHAASAGQVGLNARSIAVEALEHDPLIAPEGRYPLIRRRRLEIAPLKTFRDGRDRLLEIARIEAP